MNTLSTQVLDIADWQAARTPLLERLGIKASAIEQEFFHQGVAVMNESGSAVAVAVLYNNPSLVWKDNPTACFGNFDSENNPKAARLLLEKAQQIAHTIGKTALIGPMNGSTWGDYRVAVDAFEVSYLMDMRHPEYYAELLQAAGLETIGRYVTAKNPSIDFDRDWLASAKQAMAAKDLTFRAIKLDEYEAELERIYQFCMAVFSNNLLFTPISRAGFMAKYLPLKSLIVPQYVILCEDQSGDLCGLLFSTPNYLDNTGKGMVVKTVAKSPDPRFNGLATLLCALLHEKMEEGGFEYVLHAYMEQSNRSNGLSGHFGGHVIKQYELFGQLL
jgi:hypothetical protein